MAIGLKASIVVRKNKVEKKICYVVTLSEEFITLNAKYFNDTMD